MSLIQREVLQAARDRVLTANGDDWPWSVVGVFPTSEHLEEDGGAQWWNSFCYTVGLDEVFELWVPCQSVEGRYAGPELTGTVLNLLAAGMFTGVVAAGDTVRIPLGVPDGDDVDTMWWLGQNLEPRRRRATNMSGAPTCLPILWSSGLGWET
jgi:hypothetical protein